MKEVFVDTSGFYALVDRDDRNHGPAKRFLRRAATQKTTLVTSNYVLDEAFTLIRMRLGHATAVAFGERLAATSWCRQVEIDAAIRGSAWEIFVRFADRTFSFTDCTSFAVMGALGLSDAFTFDGRDFGAAGIRTLPGTG